MLAALARRRRSDRRSRGSRRAQASIRQGPPAASIWLRFRPLVAVAWWAAPFPAATRAVMPKAAPGTAPAAAGPRCAGDPAGSSGVLPMAGAARTLPARFIGHNSVLWPGKTPGPSPPLRCATGPRARPGQGPCAGPPAARTPRLPPGRALRRLRRFAGGSLCQPG